MVLTTSQQVALAFTAVLFTFVAVPRMFGVGTGAQETRVDPRYTKKAASPGKGQPDKPNAPGFSQSAENMQQMKKLMDQDMKADKYKPNSSKGYVFTLMPLYAIGVGVFAAYKFLKMKSADDKAQKEKFTKGAKKSVEAENQLNELEQRLAQTERMLNSILTQLDPLTNCVKSVAQEQKNEIMSQLQTIRCLMKKRGMDCSPVNEASCERNLEELIESLGASNASAAGAYLSDEQSTPGTKQADQKRPEIDDEAATEGEEMRELIPEESEGEAQVEVGAGEDNEEGKDEGRLEDSELMLSLEEMHETDIQEVGEKQRASGVRRRNRPN